MTTLFNVAGQRPGARRKRQFAVALALKFALLAGVASLAACTQVAPWERGTLAKPGMALEPDTLDAALLRHSYSSKEAATGGYGVGGGGCGCN